MKSLTLAIALLGVNLAYANTFISTTTNATVGGLSINNGDLVDLTGPRVELSGHELFGVPDGFQGSNKNLDAIAKYGNSWIFSTSTDFVYTDYVGIDHIFLDGDLVEWTPGVGMSKWMSESVFTSGSEDIDALEILPDGRVLLSTDSNATLGGLSFKPGDVVLYDRASNLATPYFIGANWFPAGVDIDALALAPDDSMLFSTVADFIIGGKRYLDGDIIS